MDNVINTDDYNISEILLYKQVEMMGEMDTEILALGTYGWLNSTLTKMITSTIKVAADNANEVFPSKSKYDKNILAHAVDKEITDINAVPAKLPILFCILERGLESLFEQQGPSKVTLSDECAISVGDYEYHFQYPIDITKKTIENNKSVYTAKYDTTYINDLSDIVNPYLPSPYRINIQGDSYIFIYCDIIQTERSVIQYKVLNDNFIDNKTYVLSFEGQLASFSVFVTNDNCTKQLIPYLENTTLPIDAGNYCWYTFIDEDTIRIKYDMNSYMPTTDDEVNIVLYTTQGTLGNFKYDENIITTLEDTDNYSYDDTQVAIMMRGPSEGGKDKKDIEEIKRQFPKQTFKNITSRIDIENHFNPYTTDRIRLVPKKKVDNQFMRAYYLYLLLKDELNNIIPMNTINMYLDSEKASHTVSIDANTNQYIYEQGIMLGYNEENRTARIVTKEEMDDYEFVYTLPFKTIINTDGPFISYYMDAVDKEYLTVYERINENAPIQFICSNINVRRPVHENKYYISVPLVQNIDVDYSVVSEDEDGNIITNNLIAVMVVYDKEGAPYRFFKSEMVNYDKENFQFNHVFELDTEGVINQNNEVGIKNGFNIGHPISSEEHAFGFFPQCCTINIYVLCKFPERSYGLENIKDFVSGVDEYTCTNMYTVKDGIKLYENYTSITQSIIDVDTINEDYTNITFSIKEVPVIGYDYSLNEDLLVKFYNLLGDCKKDIDNAIPIIDGGFTIDFKFFNTFGYSNTYTIDSNKTTMLDKVNITLNFEINLKNAADDYTKNYIIRDIQEMIETFDRDYDLHIPNITSSIYNKYINSINYITFLGFNNFDAKYQHFFTQDELEIGQVPEFVCVNKNEYGEPDIVVKLV